MLYLATQHYLFVIAPVKVSWLNRPLFLTLLDLERLWFFKLDLVENNHFSGTAMNVMAYFADLGQS